MHGLDWTDRYSLQSEGNHWKELFIDLLLCRVEGEHDTK